MRSQSSMSAMNSARFVVGFFFELKSKFQWIETELRLRAALLRLTVSIRTPRPITGDAPAVVCLTSYGNRIQYVHYTIQTIANGTCRPERIVLWISRVDRHLITRKLRLLQRRGLEIRLTEDYGSHKKYYPYCAAAHERRGDALPLATADDDVLYPSHWLGDMLDAAAAEANPVIVAHRAHRMVFDNGRIAPYLSWGLGTGTVEPRYTNVATGVCGVLYPVEFVLQIGERWGTEFMDAAPSADDLWLHSRAILLRIPTRQVRQMAPRIVEHHPNHDESLSARNVAGGQNDAVISRVYSREILSLIKSACNPQ